MALRPHDHNWTEDVRDQIAICLKYRAFSEVLPSLAGFVSLASLHGLLKTPKITGINTIECLIP